VVNTKPYDDGWMIKLRMTDESERSGLLDANGYKAKVG
jgi:glycine cleavage system H protein